MFSHCVFWTGVAPTDPGYFLSDPHYNTFDQGGQLVRSSIGGGWGWGQQLAGRSRHRHRFSSSVRLPARLS